MVGATVTITASVEEAAKNNYFYKKQSDLSTHSS